MIIRKPILVTGAHRSGSTWVGKTLCFSPDARYIHEPFNLNNKSNDYPIKTWFTYISENDPKQVQKKYANVIDQAIGLNLKGARNNCKNSESIKQLYCLLGTLKHQIQYRPLMKDPIAIFSAEWLYKTFNMDVLVLIRHPAAFAASLKVVGWGFDFNDFLSQPNLMKEKLSPFEKEILEFQAKKDVSLVDIAIVLWNIIYTQVLNYQKQYPEWIFLRHEDISKEPVKEYKILYKKLGLTYTKEAQEKIFEYTQSKEKEKLKRDSKSNIYTWKERLTEEEIRKIRKGTEEVSKHFYTEEDW